SSIYGQFGGVTVAERQIDQVAMARVNRGPVGGLNAIGGLESRPNASGSMYAMTFVYSPTDQEVFFRLRSPGARLLWVNEPLGTESARSFPLWANVERFPIRLRQGLNRLLVKTSASTSFTARIDDSQVDNGLRLFGSPLFEEAAAALGGAMAPP